MPNAPGGAVFSERQIVPKTAAQRGCASEPKLREPRRFLEGATPAGPFRPGDPLPAQSVGVLVYE